MVARRAVALAVAASCLAACGGAGQGAVEGPVLTSPGGAGDSGMDAQVVGRVDVRGGCLLLVQDDVLGDAAAPAYPVIWPAGTTWQEDPPALVLEGGRTVEPGESVTGGGGGYVQRDHIEDLAGAVVANAADECTGPTGEIALFNIGSDVDVG